MITKILKEEIENILCEGATDYLYHFTQIDNMLKILKTNTLGLSVGFTEYEFKHNRNKYFFLSLTNSRSANIGYPITFYEGLPLARITFNGRKLNSNFKIKPIDYNNLPRVKSVTLHDRSYDEMEERLISNKNIITNIYKYIESIDIRYVDEMDDMDIIKIKNIKKICDENNIKCNIVKPKYFNNKYNKKQETLGDVDNDAYDVYGDMEVEYDNKIVGEFSISTIALLKVLNHNDSNYNDYLNKLISKYDFINKNEVEKEVNKIKNNFNNFIFAYEDQLNSTNDIKNKETISIFMQLLTNFMYKNSLSSFIDLVNYSKIYLYKNKI